MNEVSFNTKFLDFISKAGITFICLIIMEIIVELLSKRTAYKWRFEYQTSFMLY